MIPTMAHRRGSPVRPVPTFLRSASSASPTDAGLPSLPELCIFGPRRTRPAPDIQMRNVHGRHETWEECRACGGVRPVSTVVGVVHVYIDRCEACSG